MENFSIFASGTFNPHFSAKSCTTISHAPELKSSCFDGNLAIHNEPSGAITDALGLAPPSEEPGAINCFNHFPSKSVSSFSKAKEACSSSLREVHGGVAYSLSFERNSPFCSVLNRSPPILASSYTPKR